jgi:type VI secretion system ImpM family protein
MYGTVKQTSAWVWGASGKHPVVKDYIRLGRETPLMNALSRWVEEGYQKLGGNTPRHSWRFFARGMKSEELSCGLIRDSHDGAGRPFPLLIMGCGPFKGWERQWDHLPSSLEALWERLEFLCTKRVFDLDELKRDIDRLPAPILPKEGRPITGSSHAISLEQAGRFAVLLGDAGDHPQEIRQWLTSLKIHLKTVPEAIFIGGPLEQSFLAAFTRPLGAADFEWLWTMN